MSPRLPDCPSWCRAAHTQPGTRHLANLDLIEHLDDRDCLVEINVVVLGDERYVELRFADVDGSHAILDLSREMAGTIGRIVELFDRRGIREIGQLLAEGAVMLAEVDQ